jgi:hypothetical protein
MDRRFGLVAAAVAIAVLVAVPISLLLAGLLLPGDPDDPNTRAAALGAMTVVPAGITAASVYAVVVRRLADDWEGRFRLAAHIRTATPFAVSALLLLLAGKVAFATPAPETAEQAAGSPYLWRAGAERMAVLALGLLVICTGLAFRKTPSRDRTMPLRVEERP